MSPAKKATRSPRLNAILFNFNGAHPVTKVLLKKVASGDDVKYYAMQNPQYFNLNRRTQTWHRAMARPVYRKNDELIFVFRDVTFKKSRINAVGAAIDFAQAIAPFDDEVTAEIRMNAARPYVFRTPKGSWPTFALAWELGVTSPPAGFPLESVGRYQYTVSLITFAVPPGEPVGGEEFLTNRYWQDPEMDIDN